MKGNVDIITNFCKKCLMLSYSFLQDWHRTAFSEHDHPFSLNILLNRTAVRRMRTSVQPDQPPRVKREIYSANANTRTKRPNKTAVQRTLKAVHGQPFFLHHLILVGRWPSPPLPNKRLGASRNRPMALAEAIPGRYPFPR